MLIEDIKSASLVARKDKDEVAKNVLVTLLSEASNVGKMNGNRQSTDQETLAVIKKFIKNSEETRNISLSGGRDTSVIDKEIEILSRWVPVQMTETSILAVLEDFKKKNQSAKLGDAMKYLKEDFSGLYDAKIASTLAKDVFK